MSEELNGTVGTNGASANGAANGANGANGAGDQVTMRLWRGDATGGEFAE